MIVVLKLSLYISCCLRCVLTVVVPSLGAMGGLYHYRPEHACADATDKVRHFIDCLPDAVTAGKMDLPRV